MSKYKYQLLRTKRRTVSVSIDPSGKLTVRAPLKLPEAQIEAYLDEKSEWIDSKIKLAQSLPQYPDLSVEEGSQIYYLGEELTVTKKGKYAHCTKPTHNFVDATLTLPDDFTVEDLREWYRDRAERVITERVSHWCRETVTSCNGVKIGNAKSRWGSCSASNYLIFTWKLILCPIEIIDYIVVHELAHTVQKNHGHTFWNMVELYIPDYMEKNKWLKRNRNIIEVE